MDTYSEPVIATLEFLKQEFHKSPYFQEHPSEREYRFNHTMRVANLGIRIAKGEGFNIEAMVLGCLLHDISYRDAFICEEDWLRHGRSSARIARDFLTSLALPQSRIEEICIGIATHVDGKADLPVETTAFTDSISDADNLDRLDAYRTYEMLEYAHFRDMKLAEQKSWLNKEIENLGSWEAEGFSTPTADRIMHERMQKRRDFYLQLLEQLDNSSHLNL